LKRRSKKETGWERGKERGAVKGKGTPDPGPLRDRRKVAENLGVGEGNRQTKENPPRIFLGVRVSLQKKGSRKGFGERRTSKTSGGSSFV